ncbi:ABC transporter substrate-binding protein [Cohnella suwonensis]|uniref:ABC transporter substrate-binding protein n=1 Tax=Cohnella suwonensis TaxID=696072 RepID=A0ABW0LVI3_9BACL
MVSKRKRLSISLSALLVFSGILAGCSSSDNGGESTPSASASSSAATSESPAASENKEPVTLEISWWGGDPRHKAIQDALVLFEKKYDWITVKPTFSGFDGYGDKLTVQLSTDGAPDVFMFSRAVSQQFGKSDVLLNLYDHKDKIPYLADLEPFMESPYYKYQDKLVGLAAGITANVVVYNKKLYDEANVPYPTDDESWKSLGEKWSSVHKAKDVYGDAGWFYMPDTFALIMKQLGKEVVDGNATPPTAVVNTEEAKKIWQWTEGLWADKSVARDSSDTIGFASGNLATALSATSVLPTTVTETQDPLGFATMPKTFDGTGSKVAIPPVPAGLWGIDKRTKHPEESILLINFLMSDPDAIKALQVTNGVPAVPASQELLKGQLAPESIEAAMVDVVARTQQGADEYWSPAQPLGIGEANAAFTTQMENFIFKGSDLDKFLSTAEAEMNAALKAANP